MRVSISLSDRYISSQLEKITSIESLSRSICVTSCVTNLTLLRWPLHCRFCSTKLSMKSHAMTSDASFTNSAVRRPIPAPSSNTVLSFTDPNAARIYNCLSARHQNFRSLTSGRSSRSMSLARESRNMPSQVGSEWSFQKDTCAERSDSPFDILLEATRGQFNNCNCTDKHCHNHVPLHHICPVK